MEWGNTTQVSIMFGAAGAGLTGVKVAQRTAQISEFRFEAVSRQVVLELTGTHPSIDRR